MSIESAPLREEQPTAFVLDQFFDEQCERLPARTRARYARILGQLPSYLPPSLRGQPADHIQAGVEALVAALEAGALPAEAGDAQAARTLGKKLTGWLRREGYI
jgi:hypothetical protein